MTYALFGSAANRYDWHTPPHHYQDDHNFILSRLPKPPGRVLDVGCGTGVFLEKAISAGFDTTGLDASAEMVSIAGGRVGSDRVRLERMQDLTESEVYDAIVSLSWSFNYVNSFLEAEDVLNRFFKALKPHGSLILQIAHAPNATGLLNEDREPGPGGQPEDVLFLYRFSGIKDNPSNLRAQYVYACKSRAELLCEEHRLGAADAREVASHAAAIGFQQIELLNSWRCDPFDRSISVFLIAVRPA
jgi:cyclopropane fatty-acyl-phospholipid synthase-like methyltransferase